jgi:hypothetical protein
MFLSHPVTSSGSKSLTWGWATKFYASLVAYGWRWQPRPPTCAVTASIGIPNCVTCTPPTIQRMRTHSRFSKRIQSGRRVFGAFLARLDSDCAFLESEACNNLLSGPACCSWAETYWPLSVVDRPRLRPPLSELPKLLEIKSELSKYIFICFMNLGLELASDRDFIVAGNVYMHDLQ